MHVISGVIKTLVDIIKGTAKNLGKKNFAHQHRVFVKKKKIKISGRKNLATEVVKVIRYRGKELKDLTNVDYNSLYMPTQLQSIYTLSPREVKAAAMELKEVKPVPEIMSSRCLNIVEDSPGFVRSADFIYFATVIYVYGPNSIIES